MSENGFSKNNINNVARDASIQNAKNNVGTKAVKAAGGPAAGKAFDALSKSKMGQDAMASMGNRSISSMRHMAPLPKLGTTNVPPQDGKAQKPTINDMVEAAEDVASKAKKAKAIWGVVSAVAPVAFWVLVTIVAIVIIVAGALTVKEQATGVFQKFGNFFTGCGWVTNEECDVKREKEFYDKIEFVYEKYRRVRKIEIDRNLLAATLTYVNPMADDADLENGIGGEVDYKKAQSEVEELAKHMVNRRVVMRIQKIKDGKVISDEPLVEGGLGNVTSDQNFFQKIGNYFLDNQINAIEDVIDRFLRNKYNADDYIGVTEFNFFDYKIIASVYYVYDEDTYKEYLRGFVNDYYLHGKGTDDQIDATIDGIFIAADINNYFDELNGFDKIKSSTTLVTITDCTGNVVLDTIGLDDYLLGVMHANADESSSLSYLYYTALATKNYLYAINGATAEALPVSLRVRNCEENQLYCSITEGCHYMDDGTLNSGAGTEYYKEPLRNEELYKLYRDVIAETKNQFLVSEGEIVKTHVDFSDMDSIEEELSDYSYEDLLIETYGGEIQIISLNEMAYPLDPEYNHITSAFGWRIEPLNKKTCEHHNGADIGAPCNANIYAIADGVVAVNEWRSMYGNVVVIGHGTINKDGSYEYYSLYAHQVSLSQYVEVGDAVLAGQQIGEVGSTGNSTGCHLHVELYSIVDGKRSRRDPIVELEQLAELNNPYAGSIEYSSVGTCMAALSPKISMNVPNYSLKGLN